MPNGRTFKALIASWILSNSSTNDLSFLSYFKVFPDNSLTAYVKLIEGERLAPIVGCPPPPFLFLPKSFCLKITSENFLC
jgi:hypothetical protein